MKSRRLGWLVIAGCAVACGLASLALLRAQSNSISIQGLTNREKRLQVSTATGGVYRIYTASNLPAAWSPLVTLSGAPASLVHTDSAAPYLPSRFYESAALNGTNDLTGDHLSTTNGDVVIHPLYHASFVMSWNGKIIYNDPDDAAAYESTYAGLPKADLILISHSHSDHLSTNKIDAVRGTNAIIITPQGVYTNLTAPQRAITTVLGYGASTNVLGLTVEAVPAYNGNHNPPGFGNGYVLTVGGRRIYISGDTGNQPEVRALPNIDVAFLCMNTPFTMSALEATNAVRAMRPKIVYPYHYRNSDNITTNAATFKQWLGQDLGIEVRLRKWY